MVLIVLLIFVVFGYVCAVIEEYLVNWQYYHVDKKVRQRRARVKRFWLKLIPCLKLIY